MSHDARPKFCPWDPTEKQKLFLECTDQEVLYGGAAGGGKSVALLMAALKYVEQPGYAALILRKDLPRLELPGGLIPRSHEWFSGLAEEGVRWNAARRTWTFPTGNQLRPATITFGYLSREADKYRYGSTEFQYIAFDELTDFLEEDYRFLFGRLRKSNAPKVTLRVRAASNPCGVGRLWVKQRFITGAQTDPQKVLTLVKERRRYVPSRIADNPHLDADEYRAALLHLPPVEREQLLSGDWDVQADGIFKAAWLRYYVLTPPQGKEPGQINLLRADGCTLATIPDEQDRFGRFITIDPASTAADQVRLGRGGRQPSWSVIQVWDQPRQHPRYLLLRDQVRGRLGFNELRDAIRDAARAWSVRRIYIENERLGKALIQNLHGELPLLAIPTAGQGKDVRSIPLQDKLSQGEVFLPQGENSWLPDFEAELLAWTGDERQPSDQIDAAAYAAIIARQEAGGVIRLAGGMYGP